MPATSRRNHTTTARHVFLAGAALAVSLQAASATCGRSEASPVAALTASAPVPEPDCWLVGVDYAVIDGQLWVIEHWKCDDGSAFDVKYPAGSSRITGILRNGPGTRM